MPTAFPPGSVTLWKADAPYTIAERITFVYTSRDLAREKPQTCIYKHRYSLLLAERNNTVIIRIAVYFVFGRSAGACR